MLSKRFFYTLLSISVMSGTAVAADIVIFEEPVPILETNSFTWEGAYIGANIGYSWKKNKNCNPYEAFVLVPSEGSTPPRLV